MSNSISDNGLYHAQDFDLRSCIITTALGQPIDFSKMVVEINYFEDIYNNFISGNLVINDSNSFLNRLSFNGNEYLSLAFGKPSSNRVVSKVFRIYGVSNRELVKDQNENYVLNFCSEENVLSEQYKVSKSFKNKKISEIVIDILKNTLQVHPDKLQLQNIEETKGVHNLIVPYLKPFETMNWLCTRAISNTPNTQGSPYLFFENLYGYNFKSLQSLYDQTNVYNTYRYEPKNLKMSEDGRVQDMESELSNVISYENISNFNTLNSINNGGFANRLIAIDTVRQKYTVNDFDYSKYFTADSKKLNTFPVISDAKNRKGDTANRTYDSVLKVVTTNTGQSTFNQYIKKNQPNIKDIDIETTVPHRTAQLSHINTIKYKLTIPGDPFMTVGRVVEFLLPELRTMEDKSRIWDIFYSGNFLVTAVRHIINQENKYVTIIEISKESVKTPYLNFNNDLPSWKELRGR